MDDEAELITASAEATETHVTTQATSAGIEAERMYSLDVIDWLFFAPIGTPRPRWEDYR